MPMTMSKIDGCDVIDCAYNMDRQCHTPAITVGDGKCAMCDTYTKADRKGGASDVIGGVGACRDSDCIHNLALECNAGNIHVGFHQNHADCETYTRR